MTKYTWIKVPVDIYNRDRAGGHGYSMAKDGMGYIGEYSAKAARGLKKDMRRKQRREARKIKAQALDAMAADHYSDVMEILEIEESWGDYGSAYDDGMLYEIESVDYGDYCYEDDFDSTWDVGCEYYYVGGYR